MTKDHSLIRRYVAAVYQLAAQANEVERVRGELARLQEAVATDARLLAVLRHPQIPQDDKRMLLLRLAGEQPSELVAGLIDLLLDKERVEVLAGAADALTELADEAAGVARAHVEVAWEPDEDQKRRLQAALSRLIGVPVVTEFHLDSEIIAGARVRVAGRVIDGSLGGQAQRMADHVRAAPMPLTDNMP